MNSNPPPASPPPSGLPTPPAQQMTQKQFEKEMKKREEEMNKKFSLTFTKKELVVIFNILLSREYKIGDAAILYPAVRKIESVIAIDTNIPLAQQGHQPPPPEAGVILDPNK